MLTPRLANVPKLIKRNFGIVAPALQKASDPIQQLFLDKIREYKSKSQGGKLVDARPETEKELKSELEKLANQYSTGNIAEMSQFPKLSFSDPQMPAPKK